MAYTKRMDLLVNISQRTGTILYLPSNGNTALDTGQFVKVSSGAIQYMDAAADDASIIGVGWGHVDASGTDKIPVITEGIFKATITSATSDIGDALKYYDTSDDGSLCDDGSANSLCWSLEYNGSAVTSLKIYVNMFLLAIVGKQFEIVAA